MLGEHVFVKSTSLVVLKGYEGFELLQYMHEWLSALVITFDLLRESQLQVKNNFEATYLTLI